MEGQQKLFCWPSLFVGSLVYDHTKKRPDLAERKKKNMEIPDLLAHFSEDPAHQLRTLQEALVLYNRIAKAGRYAEVSEAITIVDAAAMAVWDPMSVAICHARLSLVSNRIA